MKDNNEQPNFDSSTFTRTKNLFEAIRNDVNGKMSSENSYAKCGCCPETDKFPYIDGVWSQDAYSFLSGEYTPEASYDANGHLRIHPTLWNNGTNNLLSGVFEVLSDKIYQVRGYDMANITFVRSNPNEANTQSRWIILDTLMSNQCTEAALTLFQIYLNNKYGSYTLGGNISAIIISHSHIDHYGGVDAVLRYPNHFDDETAKKNDIPIYVPEGFYEHAVSENVYVGNAMGRRASYQYGSFIKPKYSKTGSNINDYTTGSISIGIGQGQSTGTPSAVPSDVIEIDCNGRKEIDNLFVDFQLTPGTEAPAEMNNYFPLYNALWLAENCTGTLHNLYTLRGAQVRDAKAWANYLMETAKLFGDKTDVIFQSHNWPHWSSKYAKNLGVKEVDIKNFLIDTAAIYKYIHDQTLLYMNMGYKMNEASDMLTLPRAMQKNWCLKPFYGTPKHNAKAVYQKYLGWYDANPLHLEELPPEQLAKEMMRYTQAGSEEKVLEMISQDISNGNYWTAAYMAHQMILSNSVNSDKAKQLCADAMQQLGYQCESGTWRNAYLSAAYELRNGKLSNFKNSADSLGNMPSEMWLDYISIFFDGERAASQLTYNGYLTVKDGKDKDNKEIVERFMFVVRNGAILYYQLQEDDKVNSQYNIVIPKSAFDDIIKGKYSGDDILCKISKALVNINCYRFKQFDIIGRRDSEVYFKNEKVDLKDAVKSCIVMLEPYIEKFVNNNNTVSLSTDDMKKWKNYYYQLLKVETHVLLESDFFVPRVSYMGIGDDGAFLEYELNYTLYSLYRYLYFSYLKNDYDFNGNAYDQESFVKLKKSIVLLESYVADYYLSASDNSVTFEEDDSKAWCYLRNLPDSKSITFTVTEFFGQLHSLYRDLSIEIDPYEGSFSIVQYSSDTFIKVYNPYCYKLMCNGSEEVSNGKIVLIDISKKGNTVVIESFNTIGSQKVITGQLVFHKPEVSFTKPKNSVMQAVDQINSSNTSEFWSDKKDYDDSVPTLQAMYGDFPPRPPFPSPVSKVSYTTKYVSELYIKGTSTNNVENGTCDSGSQIKAVSKIGFYINTTANV